MLAVSSLVYAATNTTSLGLAESRILPAAPADTHPKTPLIPFCTVKLQTLCAAHSLTTLFLATTFGPDPGELPGFWGSMDFHHAPIPQKGSGNQQQLVNLYHVRQIPRALLKQLTMLYQVQKSTAILSFIVRCYKI